MGYSILRIDLSSRSYKIDEISEKTIRDYIGGRGLGAYLLNRFVPAKVDPFGEENHIIFTAGPLSGTNFPYSPKVNLNTKSPLTNIYLYTISSGTLAIQMRKAGLWAIDIKGTSESPIYLTIQNKRVEFKDAKSIWGVEPAMAQKAMLEGQSSKNSATVAIGPAGEKLIRFASVFTEGPLYRCFGRGGAGSVMGSKKLKGLVVSGDGEIEIHDKKGFEAIKEKIRKRLKTDLRQWADLWRRYETAADLETMNELGMLPTLNWQKGQFEGWRNLDKSHTPIGWPEKGRACGPYCPTPGCREVEIKYGQYKGARSDIEWETIYAFGTSCGVDKMEAIIAASQICDEFGVDTMTTGITIGFAMECFEKGLIGLKDTDGIELRFGNDEAMIEVLKKMVKQEGFGKQISKGTMRLSSEIKGSEAFAMHVKGLELGGYECRGSNGQALQFAIDNRGGCHHGYGLPARSEIMDGTRLDIKGKGLYVKNAATSRILCDSLIVCTFPAHLLFTKELIADLLPTLIGGEWSVDELNRIGLRIMCEERLFNMKEGITRKDDSLPLRLLQEPKPDGPTKGMIVPLEELKDNYYRALGFDPLTGNPTPSLLNELGIEG